jgi:hypothetical protein
MYHAPLRKNTDPIRRPEKTTMIEITPILNQLKDLQARNDALRGYL